MDFHPKTINLQVALFGIQERFIYLSCAYINCWLRLQSQFGMKNLDLSYQIYETHTHKKVNIIDCVPANF